MTSLSQSAGRHVLGLGCVPHLALAALSEIAEEAIGRAGLCRADIGALATLDARAREPAMLALAEALAMPLLSFSAARLEEETPRLATPSARIFALIGCHGVAESAALAAAGPEARLILPKIAREKATAAVAAGRGSIAIPQGGVLVYGFPPSVSLKEKHHA